MNHEPGTIEKEINKEKTADAPGGALADASHQPASQSAKKSKQPKPPEVTCPAEVTTDTWQAFLAQRKLTKAVVTPGVIQTIEAEAKKAGWSLERALQEIPARGWRGFKADWVREESAHQMPDFMRGAI